MTKYMKITTNIEKYHHLSIIKYDIHRLNRLITIYMGHFKIESKHILNSQGFN